MVGIFTPANQLIWNASVLFRRWFRKDFLFSIELKQLGLYYLIISWLDIAQPFQKGYCVATNFYLFTARKSHLKSCRYSWTEVCYWWYLHMLKELKADFLHCLHFWSAACFMFKKQKQEYLHSTSQLSCIGKRTDLSIS